jgi:hypothetical protein
MRTDSVVYEAISFRDLAASSFSELLIDLCLPRTCEPLRWSGTISREHPSAFKQCLLRGNPSSVHAHRRGLLKQLVGFLIEGRVRE